AVDDIGIIFTPPEDGFPRRVVFASVVLVPVTHLVFGLDLDDVRIGAAGLVFQVGWDGEYFQLVYLVELFGFGNGGTRHPGQLLVHAEVVLDGDGGVGDRFTLYLDAFFGFHRLVQAIGPAAAGHQASG